LWAVEVLKSNPATWMTRGNRRNERPKIKILDEPLINSVGRSVTLLLVDNPIRMNLLLTISCLVASASAFVSQSSPAFVASRTSTQHRHMMMLSPQELASTASATTNWLATIDGDIAKISDNEFAPIFAGGLLVMFGGVISAFIVGFILDRGDLYANVVADSYAQSAEDEEFWKGLSEEERKKTQELIQKLNAEKEGGERPSLEPPSTVVTAESDEKTVVTATTVPATPEEKVPVKEVDMFSDYD
jgi:hypothetical protein